MLDMHEHHERGDGDDEQHHNIGRIARTLTIGAITFSEIKHKCVSCTIRAAGIEMLAQWIANGTIDEMEKQGVTNPMLVVEQSTEDIQGLIGDIVMRAAELLEQPVGNVRREHND